MASRLEKILDDSRYPRQIYIKLVTNEDSGDVRGPSVGANFIAGVPYLKLLCINTYDRDFKLSYVNTGLGLSTENGPLLELDRLLTIKGKGDPDFADSQVPSAARTSYVQATFRPADGSMGRIKGKDFMAKLDGRAYIKLDSEKLGNYDGYKLEVDSSDVWLKIPETDFGIGIVVPRIVFHWRNAVDLKFRPDLDPDSGFEVENLVVKVREEVVYKDGEHKRSTFELTKNASNTFPVSVFLKDSQTCLEELKVNIYSVYVEIGRLWLGIVILLFSALTFYLLLKSSTRKAFTITFGFIIYFGLYVIFFGPEYTKLATILKVISIIFTMFPAVMSILEIFKSKSVSKETGKEKTPQDIWIKLLMFVIAPATFMLIVLMNVTIGNMLNLAVILGIIWLISMVVLVFTRLEDLMRSLRPFRKEHEVADR